MVGPIGSVRHRRVLSDAPRSIRRSHRISPDLRARPRRRRRRGEDQDSVVISTVNSRPVAMPAQTPEPFKVYGDAEWRRLLGRRRRFGCASPGIRRVCRGTTAVLEDATSPYPRFKIDAYGSYVIQLFVSDPFQGVFRTPSRSRRQTAPTACWCGPGRGGRRHCGAGWTALARFAELSGAHVWALTEGPLHAAALALGGATATFVATCRHVCRPTVRARGWTAGSAEQ